MCVGSLKNQVRRRAAVMAELVLLVAQPKHPCLTTDRTGDEMVSINSVKTATRHVGFKLEGNASSRLEKMLPSINKTSGSIIGNYLNPVSPSCTTINDNVVNFYEARQRAARAIRMTVP
ncbi:uncharacterized protein LOC114262440 isoform X3 [Camellia sinensis]|uniref:uncharacterized protein LOC114262440 isoform X3 n=1 Tax=Camellia sinensis TaxID=4442 RepID=UPI001035C4CC|nr:uncharacterized protein LOC114262440 isoform X3 [Camellia sinensis]